jgi:hypothetical protein
MGREIRCRAKSGGKWREGRALLETNELLFRGDQRLKIPIREITSAIARDGQLHLKWPGNSAVFELGSQAEKWAHAILHPKSTADKLGIKPGLTISALHLSGDATMRDASQAAAAFSESTPLPDSDMILLGAGAMSDLNGIRKLMPSLAAAGAIWVVYPKSRTDITELQVLQAGRAAGLLDVKVVSYSTTHTALKFVRPKDQR